MMTNSTTVMPNVTQSEEVDLAALQKQFEDLSANADSFFLVIMAIMIYCEYLKSKCLFIELLACCTVNIAGQSKLIDG